jgi:hypothetical protein
MADHTHKHPVVRALEAAGSLRVTVTLFALSLILVFFGTLAQIDAGLWTVVSGYFRSFVVLVPLQLLVKFWRVFFNWLVPLGQDFYLPGAVPFPGGWSIGAALMVNLLAAYGLRVSGYLRRWKSYALMFAVIALDCTAGYLAVTSLDPWWFLAACGAILAANAAALLPYRQAIFFPGNRIGIFTLHIGIVLMLVGELITGLFAVEGHMRIEEGETTSVVVHNRTTELAFVDHSAAESEAVTVIPGRLLTRPGVISHEELPVDVEVVQYMPNSLLTRSEKGDAANPATRGRGLVAKAVEAGEVPGVDTKQTAEVPSVYAKLKDKTTGADLGTCLFSLWLDEQEVTVGGKAYGVSLRFKQTRKPYSLELVEFRFDRYPGTSTAKNFSSKVVLRDPGRGDRREVLIKMNRPLRHRGDTFFQADWNRETEKGTVLSVVRNPAWQLPYWSCAVVALGMLIHFGLSLANFLERRAGE